jgi:hypothetical protein
MSVIIVGVDHSAGATEALRFALEEAQMRQATPRAIHALGASYPILGEELVYPARSGVSDQLRSAAEAALDATFEEVALKLAEHEGKLRELRRRLRAGTLTLVFGARDSEDNEAVVLAEVLRRGFERSGKE